MFTRQTIWGVPRINEHLDIIREHSIPYIIRNQTNFSLEEMVGHLARITYIGVVPFRNEVRTLEGKLVYNPTFECFSIVPKGYRKPCSEIHTIVGFELIRRDPKRNFTERQVLANSI